MPLPYPGIIRPSRFHGKQASLRFFPGGECFVRSVWVLAVMPGELSGRTDSSDPASRGMSEVAE